MSIYSSDDVGSQRNDPTFIIHMKRFQLASWFPLCLSTSSFSKVSNLFLSISVIHFVVNLAHLWSPVISLRWNTTGAFTTVLSAIMKIARSLVPAVFVVATLRNKSQFEGTMNKFLSVLKTLGLWEYRMFVSCKVALGIWGIGQLMVLFQNVKFLLFGDGYLLVIDSLLGIVYSTYLLAWEFQFFYTVRTIQACFFRLTQTTITNKTNLKLFFQLHHRLIEIAAETNDFYDFPVSVVLLQFLLNFIDTTGIVVVGENLTVWRKSFLYSAAFIVAALLLCILHNGHAVSDQANKSNEALLKHLVHYKGSMHHDNPLLLIHLCAGQKLVLKACKSFTINYNLGISMVAAYLTYTIVLLQIERTPTSPNNPLNATNLTLSKSD